MFNLASIPVADEEWCRSFIASEGVNFQEGINKASLHGNCFGTERQTGQVS